jgi:cyclophilin family peptidyl-prolyl cis-trans isomerase
MIKAAILIFLAIALSAQAGTVATFNTAFGPLEVEFFDEDKPITTSNFFKYVQSGRFDNLFLQRWEPNFVIQAGGYTVGTNRQGQPDFRTVPTFGTITNEYRVGGTFSNTYGTIAMARQSGKTNSASSQWFFNLKDNSFLDSIDGGFTVFGRVTSGTNVLNQFIAAPSTNPVVKRVGVQGYRNDFGEPILLDTLPIRANVTDFEQLFTNVFFIDISLRRQVNMNLTQHEGQKIITWDSAPGVTNVVQFTSSPLSDRFVNWQTLTNIIGTGAPLEARDSFPAPRRFYRILLLY